MQTGSHQTGNVRHVNEQVRADLVCDFSEFFKVDGARVRGRTGDDHLRLFLFGKGTERIIVNETVLIHAVGHDVVQQAGLIDRRAVGQVTAVVQAHAEHGITRLAQRLIDRHVRLRARVRLHVRVFRAEQLAHAADGEVFHLIDAFAAAVVALAGIAFGVLVGQHAAHCRHNSLADDVFRGDQLNVARLSFVFCFDHTSEFGVERRHEVHCLTNHDTASCGDRTILL